jgi:hypothetical protein
MLDGLESLSSEATRPCARRLAVFLTASRGASAHHPRALWGRVCPVMCKDLRERLVNGTGMPHQIAETEQDDQHADDNGPCFHGCL